MYPLSCKKFSISLSCAAGGGVAGFYAGKKSGEETAADFGTK
jgi:hypothetical protein